MQKFIKILRPVLVKKSKTRQVYNRPQVVNLSQQPENNFWSKMIFEQQQQKKCINHA